MSAVTIPQAVCGREGFSTSYGKASTIRLLSYVLSQGSKQVSSHLLFVLNFH